MEKIQDFKLVDSTYSPQEALTVLGSLIKDKIKFLNQEILSEQVRYGKDTSHMEKRRDVLCGLEKEIIKPLNYVDNDNYEVVIDCQVNLKIREKETVDEQLVESAV